jgi:hypothetical protein
VDGGKVRGEGGGGELSWNRDKENSLKRNLKREGGKGRKRGERGLEKG